MNVDDDERSFQRICQLPFRVNWGARANHDHVEL